MGVSQSLTEEVLSLDLNTDSESALIIVSGNEFQTVGTEQQKARLTKSVLANGLSSDGTEDETTLLIYINTAAIYSMFNDIVTVYQVLNQMLH